VCDIHELSIAQLPINKRIKGDKEMVQLRLIRPQTTEDIILAARIEDNKAKAQAAIKAFRAKKYAQDRVLTQAQIDTRQPHELPEREITRRLKQIGA
jgi:hypothetical protein